MHRNKCHGRAVGIATDYELNYRGRFGVLVSLGSRIFSSPYSPDRLWGPPSLISNGYQGALSPGVKWPGREADHSPPTCADVMKTWIYTATPHTSSWHSAWLVKHRANFILMYVSCLRGLRSNKKRSKSRD
jgi:hypothetical protein